MATYAGAAASLAMRRRGPGVAELLRNITGTIDDGERDQVVMAAVHVYAQQHKEHPAGLVDQLSNSHRSATAAASILMSPLHSARAYSGGLTRKPCFQDCKEPIGRCYSRALSERSKL